MTEFEKCCKDCKYLSSRYDKYPCESCWIGDKWEIREDVLYPWLMDWLNSFDTSSATVCFTEVNLLKQRLEGDE